jgi:autotransporter-associated beta strand protein
MSTWKDPVFSTPSIVQTDFGNWGQLVPGAGESYCGPTALVMGLYWLYNNGFRQLAPGPFVAQDDSDTVNLELVIAGLMETSSDTGTAGTIETAITTYLSACGIPPTQYGYQGIDNPDLQWLALRLAPNVTPGVDMIVLADFSVAWYYPPDSSDPTSLANDGGHVLCPLTVDLGGGTLTLNNPWPPSFELVSQSAANNPQTVQIVPVPPNYTFDPPINGSSSWVISGNKGPTAKNYAVLNGADIFTISNAALPASPYVPATWTIASGTTQIINTNGGTLTVQAPLAGAANIEKIGEGTLLLTDSNALSGWLAVNGGAVASMVASGTPFGLGSVILRNGGALSIDASTVSVQIASGTKATLSAGAGGGALQLSSTGSASVTIGANTDGLKPNLVRIATGTLILQPSLGLAGLGSSQQVLVTGTGGNQPLLANGMVPPWLLAQDNDAAASGAILTYGSNGFAPAATVSSSSTAIDDASASTIYQVVANGGQTVASGTTATVAALEMAGGGLVATGGTLQVGSQAAHRFAGLVLNGGDIVGGTLAFGAAEAVLYASTAGSMITSTLSGSGGLTVCGPGGVVLAADNSASLSGLVNINSGTLAAAGANGATGSGEVFVNSKATLAVTGAVSGNVSVSQSGVLLLDGGSVTGDVSIAAVGTSTSLPGGTLQGTGTLSRTVVAAGNILSGVEPGWLVFNGTLQLPGTGTFYVRPQGLIDDTSLGKSGAGVGWNALQINQSQIIIGDGPDSRWSIYVDFSMMGGDPDSGDGFWSQPRSWSIINFATTGWTGCWSVVNSYYASGYFSYGWPDLNILTLFWTPTPPRSPAELLALRARARARRATLAVSK